ncbi:hypothetical protein [Spartinivicinus poritis]|uniref:Lipoprotein n=1 Tax=Spartinivicinus poritis TaxID=2994640 RepID=A0ABT5UBA6_9GAMM|nr:hypothetical protein [Spartinivicinus sp. A2-2]MDE1463658.1 hypothetical protein [Spartinivicinus sp. A2-2]
MMRLSSSLLLPVSLLSVLLITACTSNPPVEPSIKQQTSFNTVPTNYDYQGADYNKQLGAYAQRIQYANKWLENSSSYDLFSFYKPKRETLSLTATNWRQLKQSVTSDLLHKPVVQVRFHIPKNIKQSLLRAFKQQKGLLTPALKLNSANEIIPDIEKTTLLHNWFKEKQQFSLLSLKNTLKYHVRFVTSVESQCPNREQQGMTNCVMKSWVLSNNLNLGDDHSPYNLSYLNRLLNEHLPKIGYMIIPDQPLVESPAVVHMKFADHSKTLTSATPQRRAADISPYFTASRIDFVLVDSASQQLEGKLTKNSAYCEAKLLQLEALDALKNSVKPTLKQRQQIMAYTDKIASEFCKNTLKQLIK